MELLFSTLQAYSGLTFWIIPEIMCAVEFFFKDAGAYRFSTE